MAFVLLGVALLVILLGAELFTNGIEWFGHKLNLAEGAVGSVLAAVGTALPETTIPIVAILFTAKAGADEIGVGAILGAPFMLSTLAIAVTGVVVLAYAGRRSQGRLLDVDPVALRSDLRAFVAFYALAIGSAFLPADQPWLRSLVAAVLILSYGLYVRAHFEADADVDAEDLVPLRLHRLDRRAHRHDPARPRLRVISLQVAAGVGLILLGAATFVEVVGEVATTLGVDDVLFALVVAPIATELPEAANAILWARQGKDRLAIANITGAMVFQASIVTVVALVFAPTAWVVGPETRLAFASAGLAILSIGVVFLPALRGRQLSARQLLLGGVVYLGYLGIVLSVVFSGH
jgi:cation:H+ antiporter